MARYFTRPTPTRSADTRSFADADTGGQEVIDTGDWSDDQPTGVLDASGAMIWRTGRAVGFLADHD